MSKTVDTHDVIETSISLQNDNTSSQYGFTIRQLIKGRKDKNIDRIARDFRVTIKASRSDEPVITIKGEKRSVDQAFEIIQKLRLTAEDTVSREKITGKSQINTKHWGEIEQTLKPLLPERKLDRAVIASPAESASTTFNAAAPAGQKANREGKLKISPFVPRNRAQALSYLAMHDKSISFFVCAGPQGSSKSFTQLQVGLERWLKGEFDQILIIRPPVTVGGRDPGTPPGDPKKKQSHFFKALDPNALLIAGMTMEQLDQKGIVRWATPDYLRGTTLHKTFVIIEEAQNFPPGVIETLFGRMGEGSFCAVNGDISGDQSDLKNEMPGLVSLIAKIAYASLKDKEIENGIAFVQHSESDSKARHPLLPNLLKAFNDSTNPFMGIMDSMRATSPNPARSLAIQQGYSFARDMLEKVASRTINNYEKQLRDKFPQFASDSNVTAFRRQGPR